MKAIKCSFIKELKKKVSILSGQRNQQKMYVHIYFVVQPCGAHIKQT